MNNSKSVAVNLRALADDYFLLYTKNGSMPDTGVIYDTITFQRLSKAYIFYKKSNFFTSSVNSANNVGNVSNVRAVSTDEIYGFELSQSQAHRYLKRDVISLLRGWSTYFYHHYKKALASNTDANKWLFTKENFARESSLDVDELLALFPGSNDNSIKEDGWEKLTAENRIIPL